MRFTGCGTALITPFLSDGGLDETTLRDLVRRQVENGIDFLVPCGTTGEASTLTRKDARRVMRIAVEEAGGTPVLAGAGGNNTVEVAEWARECESLGVAGLLSVTPYYNKPTQRGLVQHYRAVAEAVSLPIILYSIQGRTGVNIEPATVAELARADNIVGIKEASGNISQIGAIIAQAEKDFVVLSGDDAVTLPLIALGGHGAISVASNIAPREIVELVRAALAGDMARARTLHRRLMPLFDACFMETNPIPVKAAMALLGLCEPVWRLPMTPPAPESEARILTALQAVGLLEERAAHAIN